MFGSSGGWAMGAGMWIFWIVLLIIIVALVKIISPGGAPSAPARDQGPADILKARYARGEIDEDEFERRMKELDK